MAAVLAEPTAKGSCMPWDEPSAPVLTVYGFSCRGPDPDVSPACIKLLTCVRQCDELRYCIHG